ncbi:MAG TPA: hypothetical protein VG225_09625 [Terracidiphilus sp.]|jgi:hypothetical protein|nr:hypothetical protein [Terracidiphilus sp.]
MPLSSDNQLPPHGPSEIDASHGYERSDVRVTGIVVFLTALGIFVAVTGFLCYGIGKVINAAMNKEDGPNTKWTKSVDVQIRQLGNFPSSPELQNKVSELAQQFPTPRVQTDDGNQDVADLHAREDLLLDHYTQIDGQPGKVRIPIDRAMELIAQRGLPVAPPAQNGPSMAGDRQPVVQAPLTSGFARTAFELEQERGEGARAERPTMQK